MNRGGWIGKAAAALGLLALTLIGIIWGAHLRGRRPGHPQPHLLVAFLSVGTGDCTLIRTPDGHAALVDTGPAAAAPAVAQTLRTEGIRSLDLLVLTSAAPGSVGGVPGLLAGGITVAQVWDAQALPAGDAGQVALAALHTHQVPVRAAARDDRIFLGSRGVRLTALWPPEHGTRAGSDALVCRLDYGETGLVLAGPADGTEQNYLVASAGNALACDILQVADGGADGATSPELLRRATPAVAVISCGMDSPPGGQTLHRLQAAGAEIWRTDAQGAITLYSDGRGAPVIRVARMDGH